MRRRRKNLQEIHTSDPVTDKLDHSFDQHPNLCLLLREHLQRGGFPHSVHGKRREASRLPWRRLVFAVKLGRLPSANRVGKNHGWKGTFPSHLDTKTPTHLNHLCSLITRIGLFHRLRTTGENVLEKTPVRPTTQEILAQRHKSSKIHDCVGSEVVELCPKEIQKSPKERVRRQGKSTVDVGGKENALTLPRLRLGFLPRKMRQSMGDQSSVG